jgi:hypothetical protein
LDGIGSTQQMETPIHFYYEFLHAGESFSTE